jgi:hypothetical protein
VADRNGTEPTREQAPGANRDGLPVIEVASVEPRIFGAVPPVLALALGLIGIFLGAALLATGSVAGGLVVLFAGAALLALALDASRRWPTSAIPRLSSRAAEAIRGRLGVAGVSAGAWSVAGREVIRLKGELRDLRGVREAHLLELGLAAYREDGPRVDALRSEIANLDERTADSERELTAAVGHAKQRVKKKRAAVQPTQSFAVPETQPPLEEDDDTRTAPTAERPFPSADSA